jgi:Ca-activated chloride channel family protein
MNRSFFSRRIAPPVLFLLIVLSSASAQNEKPATAPPPQLVKISLIVTDRSERAVDDVRKEDVQVLEDGLVRTIADFARDDRPVSCGIIIDASGSVRRILNYLIDASKTAAGGLRDGDEGFVASFVDSANFKIKEDMTLDREAIPDAVDDVYVEGGQTAVHDAVDKALRYLNDHQAGDAATRRRVLVLVTDGEDRGSKIKDSKTILATVRQSDVQIFVLGLTKFSGLQSSAGKATDFLNGLAELSGGRVFFPESPSDLPEAAREVARELHAQFVAGYNGPAKPAGTERRIQAKWIGRADAGKRKVITRPSVTIK